MKLSKNSIYSAIHWGDFSKKFIEVMNKSKRNRWILDMIPAALHLENLHLNLFTTSFTWNFGFPSCKIGWNLPFLNEIPMRVHRLSEETGEYKFVDLGLNCDFQCVIPHGIWFASESNSFSLIGVTVAPWFEFCVSLQRTPETVSRVHNRQRCVPTRRCPRDSPSLHSASPICSTLRSHYGS